MKKISRILFVILLIVPFADCVQSDDNLLKNRAGFGMAVQADPVYWANELQADWYIDWKTTPRHADQFPEYWQTIRLSADSYTPAKSDLKKLVRRYRGNTWIIGNEPDNPWQDNIPAEDYAVYYHELYHLIKSIDPSAKIAIGAITQPTPLRLAYLDEVLNTYQEMYHTTLPVDWWTIHAYILREENDSWGAGIPARMDNSLATLYDIQDHNNIQIFISQIETFRKWMAQNGYRNKPLAITEFGILFPATLGFTPDLVSKYLDETFTYLYDASNPETGYEADDNHLVQRWAWFSLNDPEYMVADLANLQMTQLTPLGVAFRETVLRYKEKVQ